MILNKFGLLNIRLGTPRNSREIILSSDENVCTGGEWIMYG